MMDILGVKVRRRSEFNSVEAELSGHAPLGDRGYMVSVIGWADTEDEALAVIAEGLQELEEGDALQRFAEADERIAPHKTRIAERWDLARRIASGGEVTEEESQRDDFAWALNIAEDMRANPRSSADR